MKENEVILTRQKINTKFKNGDMDFMLNWAIGISQIIGMSPAQIFYAVHNIKDGDPVGWRKGFQEQGYYQVQRAQQLMAEHHNLIAGQLLLGAAYAYRASLQYTDPTAVEFNEYASKMEKTFQQGIELLHIPMRPIEVPFENTSLAGYFLEQDKQPRPAVIMVGGGDTFREDLFYFAGYPGWKRGYNVIMVDLPGQGLMPNRGQHFRVDMNKPISTILDWLEKNTAIKDGQIAIYGVSGGGYFTTQAVAADPRLRAWIAATPIFDVAQVFQREFGNVLKTPGWLLNLAMQVTGSLNETAKINLDKYAWQFGMSDFKSAADQVLIQAKPVDYSNIHCPSLFLVSEGEGPELKRQAFALYDHFVQRGVNVTLQEFTAADGADGHCQLNNLRLAHLVIFNWLDQIFQKEPEDARLLC